MFQKKNLATFFLNLIIFLQNTRRNQIVLDQFHFLETFVYSDFADATFRANIALANIHITHLRDEIYDSRRHRVWRIVCNNIVVHDFVCDEFRQHRQFRIQTQQTTKPVDKHHRSRRTQIRLLFWRNTSLNIC